MREHPAPCVIPPAPSITHAPQHRLVDRCGRAWVRMCRRNCGNSSPPPPDPVHTAHRRWDRRGPGRQATATGGQGDTTVDFLRRSPGDVPQQPIEGRRRRCGRGRGRWRPRRCCSPPVDARADCAPGNGRFHAALVPVGMTLERWRRTPRQLHIGLGADGDDHAPGQVPEGRAAGSLPAARGTEPTGCTRPPGAGALGQWPVPFPAPDQDAVRPSGAVRRRCGCGAGSHQCER